jgi:hypothetical protein
MRTGFHSASFCLAATSPGGGMAWRIVRHEVIALLAVPYFAAEPYFAADSRDGADWKLPAPKGPAPGADRTVSFSGPAGTLVIRRVASRARVISRRWSTCRAGI